MIPAIRQLARSISSRMSRPVGGFTFDRPVVLLQSDDWGRVGVRDREGWDELRAAGLSLGEKSYDYYSLETAEDVDAIHQILSKHRDSAGRAPRLVMNFCVANLDFERVQGSNFQSLDLKPLSQGLPGKWNRPGLLEAYRRGIANGVFYPAPHGSTHFCRSAMERHLTDDGTRGSLVRTLLRAHTPYIHWRMPWIGFEYWDQEFAPQFLPGAVQGKLIHDTVAAFVELFGTLPLSACAPGYRANANTRHAWADCGIRVAQNGPSLTAPHFDDSGLLHTYRTVELEPALDPARYSVDGCLERAAACFQRGIPAIVSVHSINFHSTLKNFRGPTLHLLDEFLSALEHRYEDLVYLHDLELHGLLQAAQRESGRTNVVVQMENPAGVAGGAR